MIHTLRIIFFVSLLLLISSCTIYRSAERDQFESESAQFKVQNLVLVSCSKESVQNYASQAKLITTEGDHFIWEYIIESKSIYESQTPSNSEYCIYEKKSENNR